MPVIKINDKILLSLKTKYQKSKSVMPVLYLERVLFSRHFHNFQLKISGTSKLNKEFYKK